MKKRRRPPAPGLPPNPLRTQMAKIAKRGQAGMPHYQQQRRRASMPEPLPLPPMVQGETPSFIDMEVLFVPSAAVSLVLGHGHRNQIRIERESGAKLLVVPKNDANNGERNVGGHWQQDGYQMMLFLHQDSNNSKNRTNFSSDRSRGAGSGTDDDDDDEDFDTPGAASNNNFRLPDALGVLASAPKKGDQRPSLHSAADSRRAYGSPASVARDLVAVQLFEKGWTCRLHPFEDIPAEAPRLAPEVFLCDQGGGKGSPCYSPPSQLPHLRRDAVVELSTFLGRGAFGEVRLARVSLPAVSGDAPAVSGKEGKRRRAWRDATAKHDEAVDTSAAATSVALKSARRSSTAGHNPLRELAKEAELLDRLQHSMNSGIQGVTDGQEEGARNVVYFHGYIEGRSPFSSSSSRGHLQPPPEVLTIALERGSCSLAEALHRDGLGNAFESSSSSQGRSSSSCSCSDLSLRWPETWQTPKGGGLFGRQSGVGGLCLSLRNRLAIAQDVTAGVNHAHSHGVLHRDLKSENVIVNFMHIDDPRSAAFGRMSGRSSNGCGRIMVVAKIADFGAARTMDEWKRGSEVVDLQRGGSGRTSHAIAAIGSTRRRGEAEERHEVEDGEIVSGSDNSDDENQARGTKTAQGFVLVRRAYSEGRTTLPYCPPEAFPLNAVVPNRRERAHRAAAAEAKANADTKAFDAASRAAMEAKQAHRENAQRHGHSQYHWSLDVYSLGVLMWEIFTSLFPFEHIVVAEWYTKQLWRLSNGSEAKVAGRMLEQPTILPQCVFHGARPNALLLRALRPRAVFDPLEKLIVDCWVKDRTPQEQQQPYGRLPLKEHHRDAVGPSHPESPLLSTSKCAQGLSSRRPHTNEVQRRLALISTAIAAKSDSELAPVQSNRLPASSSSPDSMEMQSASNNSPSKGLPTLLLPPPPPPLSISGSCGSQFGRLTRSRSGPAEAVALRGVDSAYSEVCGVLQGLCPAQCTLHSFRSAEFFRTAAAGYLADRTQDLGGGMPHLGGGWVLAPSTSSDGKASAKWV